MAKGGSLPASQAITVGHLMTRFFAFWFCAVWPGRQANRPAVLKHSGMPILSRRRTLAKRSEGQRKFGGAMTRRSVIWLHLNVAIRLAGMLTCLAAQIEAADTPLAS